MIKVKVEESVGMVLGHDLTKVAKDFKGTAFKKGHIIRQEDIEQLKNIGKEHIYLIEMTEDQIHEEEAAVRMAEAAAGRGIRFLPVSEGKVSMVAAYQGLLKINVPLLQQVNMIDEICMSMLHNNTPVKPDQIVAGTRIIPLVTDKERIETVERLCADQKVVEVLPYRSLKVGLVVTGNEVYYGRIQDRFRPVMTEKMAALGCCLEHVHYAPDETETISACIQDLLAKGCEMIIAAGGMSVDPDDVTPEGIRATGAQVVSYGAPVLPGAMFMLAYHGQVPVMGMPACGMFHRTTVLDLILPRLLVGERITKADLAMLGHGGLCLRCEVCDYPRCGFGK